jgi:hypothetical protein
MDARSQDNLPRPYITSSISLHYVSTIDRALIGHVTFLRILIGHSIPWHTVDSRDKERSSASWVGKSYPLRVGYIKGLHATTTGAPHVQQTMKTTIMFINVSTLLARNGAHHYWTRYSTSFTLSWIQDLWQLLEIGIRAYFNDSSPDFSERFPQGYSSTPYNDVIIQQNAIGWDHFIRGKVSKERSQVQYLHAKRYGMVKQSEGWMLGSIKLMANCAINVVTDTTMLRDKILHVLKI